MFTGIIEEVGRVEKISQRGNLTLLTVAAQIVTKEVKLGDSIATNGVCLTIAELTENTFTAEIMAQTLLCTNFSKLQAGENLNLERALKINSRLDGHLVQGHVDGVGKIVRILKEGHKVTYEITCSAQILRQIVERGSVALDGISLTVSKVKDCSFEVCLIPTTLKETNLRDRKVQDSIHIETDIIGKYMEKMLQQRESSIDRNFLTRCGF